MTAAAAECRNWGPASNLARESGKPPAGEEGVSRGVTLAGDSPCVHPPREVVGVKAVPWWVSGKVSWI